MEERHKIEERLRRKEAEIVGLEDKIKAARSYAQALRDVLKILSPGERDEAPASSESVLRQGSSVAQARDVIARRGVPVHINELLEEMGREASRDNRASLTSSLAAYVRRGEIFTRPAPNTFGLLELGHSTVEEEPVEPPSGFGRLSPPSPPKQAPPQDDDVPF